MWQESKHFEIVHRLRRATGDIDCRTQRNAHTHIYIYPRTRLTLLPPRSAPLDYEIKMDDGRNENGIFNELAK